MIISENILNKRFESAFNALGWSGLMDNEKTRATTRIYVNFTLNSIYLFFSNGRIKGGENYFWNHRSNVRRN